MLEATTHPQIRRELDPLAGDWIRDLDRNRRFAVPAPVPGERGKDLPITAAWIRERVGLLTGRKVYVLTARGGDYSADGPIHAMDHQTPYLRTVLSFMGLTDVTFIHAQGVAKGDDGITRAGAEIDDTITAARLAA